MKIEELFHQENILPTAPRVVQYLINSFYDEQMPADELAHHIALDPVLSTNLLRLANSPYYRTSRQIGSVEAAVTLLGFVTVRTLVITCSLVTSFKATPGLDLRQFWRYSLTTAVVGKWLAQRCGPRRPVKIPHRWPLQNPPVDDPRRSYPAMRREAWQDIIRALETDEGNRSECLDATEEKHRRDAAGQGRLAA